MIGGYFCSLGIWPRICARVEIAQKVKQYRPHDKLLDCFIHILAGGRGLSQIETLVRPDAALQRAFGRSACAEQSTISDTLDACTAQTDEQMRAVLCEVFQRHSRSYRHDYTQQMQQVDVDMTGWPAGAQCEGAEKGFFADQAHRRGRQLGRVLASAYDEVVVDRLYAGKRQLEHCLPELVSEAEGVLGLQGDSAAARKKRANTVVRVDGGGGTEADINWLLARDYRIMLKVRNAQRARKLAESVGTWVADPQVLGRQVGWVERPTPYVAPTRQLAIRHRKTGGKHAGEFGDSVLVFNLSDVPLAQLLGSPPPASPTDAQALFNALHYYDRRGGGVETQIKGDKGGLGLAHRNKRRFYAQAMLVQLGHLAHNWVIWSRNRLARIDARFTHFGILRMVRDVYSISGFVDCDPSGGVQHVELNDRHPYAASVARAFAPPYV